MPTLSVLSQSVLLPVSLQGSGPLALSTAYMFVNPRASHEVPRIRQSVLLTLQNLLQILLQLICMEAAVSLLQRMQVRVLLY